MSDNHVNTRDVALIKIAEAIEQAFNNNVGIFLLQCIIFTTPAASMWLMPTHATVWFWDIWNTIVLLGFLIQVATFLYDKEFTPTWMKGMAGFPAFVRVVPPIVGWVLAEMSGHQDPTMFYFVAVVTFVLISEIELKPVREEINR